MPVLGQPKKEFSLNTGNIAFYCPERCIANKTCSHCSKIWEKFREQVIDLQRCSDTGRNNQSSISKFAENVKW